MIIPATLVLCKGGTESTNIFAEKFRAHFPRTSISALVRSEHEHLASFVALMFYDNRAKFNLFL